MPRYIIKLNDKYGMWSTIVDAPVSYLMDLDQFKEYYRAEYGESMMAGLNDRIKRVDIKGTSSMLGETVDDLIEGNCAGTDGKKLTKSEIIDMMTKK